MVPMHARSADFIACRFLCFYLILFLVHCNALAMFRMFAALTRDMVVANSVGSCFLVVFLMLSGYIFAQSAQPCSLVATLPVASQSTSLLACIPAASRLLSSGCMPWPRSLRCLPNGNG